MRLAIEEQLQASGEQERAKFHDLQTELREKESELAELAKLLQTVQERLCEQKTKREESQRKLQLLQKTTALQTSKSQEDLDKYCDRVTKLCEELTDLKKKSEDQQKEIEKLRETLKRAEQIEVEYTEATRRLSEAEPKFEAVESQAWLVLPTAGGADTARTTAAVDAELQAKTATVDKLEKEVDELRAELEARDQEVRELKGKERESSPHTSKEVKKLKREVDEKLRSRDEELSDLKKGNTPFVDASLSPTDSMNADSSEVVELKLKMRERETELENLRRQVQSMEQALLELNRLRKVSESLKMENEKLSHRHKTFSEHSKRQSEQIMALRKQLETRPLPVSIMYSFT